MVVGATLAIRGSAVERSVAALLSVGGFALFVQQIADVAVGVLLRGMTLGAHVAQFGTVPGMIYAALLVMFVIVPWMVGREAKSR